MERRPATLSILLALVLPIFPSVGFAESLPTVPADSLGFDAERLARINAAVDEAVGAGQIPGAVVLVGRRGAIGHAYAAGKRSVSPADEPMTRDTIFDMASLTKPVATATAVMILLEEGKLRLDDPITRHLPELNNHGKNRITVEHLLRHRAGLIPDNSIKDYENGAEAAWSKIAEIELAGVPGERFVYSDLSFQVLGKLVEKVSGQPLDQFARERIFQPIGMTDAHFRPTGSSGEALPSLERIAPTEAAEKGGPVLRGIVHDPRARAVGGVAGHAGLFATADDIAVFAQTLLNGGRSPSGRRLLAPLTVRAMISPGTTPAGQKRGLGWDLETGFSSPRGLFFGPESFGHTGFTGTSLWVDPETETFVVLLTSRLHPDGGKPSPVSLRYKVATLTAAAITDASPRQTISNDEPRDSARSQTAINSKDLQVKCGIDVLIDDQFKPLQGKRVGLITNHTGVARDGRSTIDVLFHAPGVELKKLFGPEHGIRGELDTVVNDGKDAATGLPVISLYTEKRAPSKEDLEDLDVLVFDIQDVGVRYYTYSSTLGLAIEAAKGSGKKFIVLDRPNPIGGITVSGPVRDQDQESFIAYHTVPLRHGLTLGELALLYNTERRIQADLDVVKCQGWTREMAYDRTGLLWINPSPNMRNLVEAFLYPGVGWLEATNLATGRGTDTPFERLGAPWIDPVAFSNAMNASGVKGVRFTPIWFSPTERQYKGERCGGVQIMITHLDELDPVAMGVRLAATLRALYPNDWKPEGLLKLLCHRRAYQAIVEGKPAPQVEALWQADLQRFKLVRMNYLLYERGD